MNNNNKIERKDKVRYIGKGDNELFNSIMELMKGEVTHNKDGRVTVCLFHPITHFTANEDELRLIQKRQKENEK